MSVALKLSILASEEIICYLLFHCCHYSKGHENAQNMPRYYPVEQDKTLLNTAQQNGHTVNDTNIFFFPFFGLDRQSNKLLSVADFFVGH